MFTLTSSPPFKSIIWIKTLESIPQKYLKIFFLQKKQTHGHVSELSWNLHFLGNFSFKFLKWHEERREQPWNNNLKAWQKINKL